MNDALRVELEQMHAEDQAVRGDVWAVVQEFGTESPQYEALREQGLEVDAKNIARLIEILEEHGWPGHSLVGEVACTGAFLILQHADLPIQKTYLPLLREATAAGESKTTALALLEDRIRLHEGEKQIYGSQFVRGKDGQAELWPIEDEAHVDERRAQVGLEPLASYLERVGLGHLHKDAAPE